MLIEHTAVTNYINEMQAYLHARIMWHGTDDFYEGYAFALKHLKEHMKVLTSIKEEGEVNFEV